MPEKDKDAVVLASDEMHRKSQARFKCPISLEIMDDPVTLVQTGLTYNRPAIKEWLKENNTCPVRNVRLTNRTLIPNLLLRDELESWNYPLKPLGGDVGDKIEHPLPTVLSFDMVKAIKDLLLLGREDMRSFLDSFPSRRELLFGKFSKVFKMNALLKPFIACVAETERKRLQNFLE